jgi:hypothetical protein
MSDKTKFYFCKFFLAVPFFVCNKIILRRLHRTAVPTRKAVLEETCLALGHWLACCLPRLGKLLLPCLSYQAQHCPADMASAKDQTGLPIGLALARLHHGLALGVFRVMSPTPPRVALRGPQKDFFAINEWRSAIHWLVLGCPRKAHSRPRKIGQSPTRRFLKISQLVGILACLGRSLLAFL